LISSPDDQPNNAHLGLQIRSVLYPDDLFPWTIIHKGEACCKATGSRKPTRRLETSNRPEERDEATVLADLLISLLSPLPLLAGLAERHSSDAARYRGAMAPAKIPALLALEVQRAEKWMGWLSSRPDGIYRGNRCTPASLMMSMNSG